MADQILTTFCRLTPRFREGKLEAFRRMLVEDTSASMASEAALLVLALIFTAAAVASAGVWLLGMMVP